MINSYFSQKILDPDFTLAITGFEHLFPTLINIGYDQTVTLFKVSLSINRSWHMSKLSVSLLMNILCQYCSLFPLIFFNKPNYSDMRFLRNS
jgi:hypothetical protein